MCIRGADAAAGIDASDATTRTRREAMQSTRYGHASQSTRRRTKMNWKYFLSFHRYRCCCCFWCWLVPPRSRQKGRLEGRQSKHSLCANAEQFPSPRCFRCSTKLTATPTSNVVVVLLLLFWNGGARGGRGNGRMRGLLLLSNKRCIPPTTQAIRIIIYSGMLSSSSSRSIRGYLHRKWGGGGAVVGTKFLASNPIRGDNYYPNMQIICVCSSPVIL